MTTSMQLVCCAVLQAMFAGFLEADKICQGRFKVSGTTATLAVVVGWEVFVANVGDSAAYLDTGKQVGGAVCVFDRACVCLAGVGGGGTGRRVGWCRLCRPAVAA